MKIHYTLAFIATLLMATSASAATVSYNLNYGPEAIGLAAHSVGPLSQFDPSFGTLNSVKLTLNSNATGGVLLWDNESNDAGFVTLSVGGTITATTTLGGFTITAVPAQVGGPQAITPDNDAAPDFIGSDAFQIAGGIGSDMDMQTLVLPGAIAPYIGLGSFNVNIASSLYTNVATSGGNIFGPTQPFGGNTDGVVTVTYDYTPIPEPSSMALLGLGVVGLITVIRKRKIA